MKDEELEVGDSVGRILTLSPGLLLNTAEAKDEYG